VHDLRFRSRFAKRIWRQWRRNRCAAAQRCTVPVELLDSRVMAGRLRHVLQQPVYESVRIARFERLAEHTLISNCRLPTIADGLAARGPGAMAGVYLDAVAQGHERLEQGTVQLARERAGFLFAEQVGPAYVEVEQGVSGEYPEGLLALHVVAEQQRDVLGCVARSVQHFQAHGAELNPL